MNINIFKFAVLAAFLLPTVIAKAEDAPVADNSNSSNVVQLTVVAPEVPGSENSNSSSGNGAPVSDNSNSSSGSATTPGTDNSNSSSSGLPIPGSDNSNSTGGSAGPSSSVVTTVSGGGSSGGSSSSAFIMSPLYIIRLEGNNFWVAFSTTPSSEGLIAYGTVSQPAYNPALTHFGYQNGSAYDTSSVAHGFVVTLQPGVKYFIRPVARVGSAVYYGTEVAITPKAGAQVIETTTTNPVVQVAEVGTSPAGIVAGNSTASSSDENLNTASASGAVSSSIVSFFKNLWQNLTSSMCQIPN